MTDDKKKQTSSRPFIAVLAALLLLIGGSKVACATETQTANFNSGLPAGWSLVGSAIYNDSDRARTGKGVWSNGKSDTANFLVTEAIEGSLSLYWRSFGTSGSYPNGYLTVYQYNGSALGDVIQETSTYKSSTWKAETIDLGDYRGQVAIALYSACIDDVTYTPYHAADTPTLTVNGFASGSSYDFGGVPVAEGTTKTFMLKNIGLAELLISSIEVTGGYVLTAGSELTTIAAQSIAEVTVATPAEDVTGTLTITSNDAESPYVIHLQSSYRAPAPEMAVDLTTVVFGRVTDVATQDITVSNTGDAPLQVSVSSDQDDFVVSKTELTVEAGESASFTISFLYDAEAYGGHEASITLTPNVGESVSIQVSAYVQDPNMWTEDFDEGELPDGWTTIGWAVGTSTAFKNTTPMPLAPTDYDMGTLITPRLKAKEGDMLTWDAYLRWNDEYLVVEYSDDDMVSWNTIYNYKAADDGLSDKAHKAMSFTAPADGHYYLRFSARFQTGVDNFSGFTLDPAEVVRETWHVSYTFYYPDDNAEWKSLMEEEEIEVEFEGNKVSFNFPNPVTGNAWMTGSKDADGNIVFPSGQYIGKFGDESAYFCGYDGTVLTDITFFVHEDGDSYLCMMPILINSSKTDISYWFYFSTVVVSKEVIPVGITTAGTQLSSRRSGIYDLQGRKVEYPSHGLYIVNGHKVMMK